MILSLYYQNFILINSIKKLFKSLWILFKLNKPINKKNNIQILVLTKFKVDKHSILYNKIKKDMILEKLLYGNLQIINYFN